MVCYVLGTTGLSGNCLGRRKKLGSERKGRGTGVIRIVEWKGEDEVIRIVEDRKGRMESLG